MDWIGRGASRADVEAIAYGRGSFGGAAGGASIATRQYYTSLEQLAADFKAGNELSRGQTLARYREEPYANHVTAYSCMRIVSQAAAHIPRKLYRRKPGPKGRPREEVTSSKVLPLLENPHESYYADFTQMMEYAWLYLEAGGNVWFERDKPNSVGVPRSLRVWGTRQIRPLQDRATAELQGWELVLNGRTAGWFKPRDLLHVKYADPSDANQLLGIAPLRAAQSDIDRDSAQKRYEAAFYNRGGFSPTVLEYAPPNVTSVDSLFLNDVRLQQIREGWVDKNGGVDNAGVPAILHGGMKLHELGVTGQTIVSLDEKRWTREQVAMAHGVPVRLLNAVKDGALSREDLKSALYALYIMTVVPRLGFMQGGLNRWLIWPIDPTVELVFDTDDLDVLAEEFATKVADGKGLVEMGYPLNMVNEKLELGMDEVDWGDEHLVSPLLVPASRVVDEAYEAALGPALPQDETADDTEEPPASEKGKPADKAKGKAKDDEKQTDKGAPQEDQQQVASLTGARELAEFHAAVTAAATRATPLTAPTFTKLQDTRRRTLWRTKLAKLWMPTERAYRKGLEKYLVRVMAEVRENTEAALAAGAFQTRMTQAQATVLRAVPTEVLEAPEERLAPLLRELGAGERVIGELVAVTRTLEDDLDAIDFDMPDADARLRRLSMPYFEQAIRVGAKDIADTVGGDALGIDAPLAVETLQRKRMKIVERNRTIRRQLRETVRKAALAGFEAGDTTDDLRQRIRGAVAKVRKITIARAATIARTETGESVNMGRLSEMKVQRVEEHEWLSAGDDVVRRPPDKGGDSKFDHWIDGEVRTVGAEFSNGLKVPNDSDCKDAGNVCNCRCLTVPRTRQRRAA